MTITRRHFAAALTCGAAALTTASRVRAHGYAAKDIEIVHPWAFEAERGTDAIVGMELRNAGRTLERLIGVEAKGAERVELRGLSPPPRGRKPGVDIPPRGRVDLHSDGPHALLIGLRESLIAYGSTPIVLIFEKIGRVPVDVIVEERRV